MIKKYIGSTQGPLKDIIIIEVVLLTKYIDTELVYLTTCEKKKRIYVEILY